MRKRRGPKHTHPPKPPRPPRPIPADRPAPAVRGARLYCVRRINRLGDITVVRESLSGTDLERWFWRRVGYLGEGMIMELVTPTGRVQAYVDHTNWSTPHGS